MKKVIIFNLVLLMVLSVGCTSEVTQDKPLIGITSTYSASSSGSRRAPAGQDLTRRDPNSFRRNFTRQDAARRGAVRPDVARQETTRPGAPRPAAAQRDPNAPSRASTRVGFSYVQAVLESGGIPIVLPTVSDEQAIQRYVDKLDGLVIIGGSDIPPDAYGQEQHEKTRPMPQQRYDFESKLIPAWLESGKPFLGVCLGMQFTNVAAGGPLIQDIPSMVETEIKHSGGSYHPVQIDPDSHLAQRVGGMGAEVYSSHHQSVQDVAPGFKVVAHSADGIIEALERTEGGWGLCVQWHPEAMSNVEHRKAVYGALIEACKK